MRTKTPKRQTPAKRPPQKNRLAREGWASPHVFDGIAYPPLEDASSWYSTAEAIAKLGLTAKTVRKYADEGMIESKRHGYYKLFSKRDVDALAEASPSSSRRSRK